ncbi:MAG: rhodanese-like domain-containing protein [Chthoniobacteraceae bacterium]
MKILQTLLIAAILNFTPHAISDEPKQPAAAKVSPVKDVTPDEAAALMKDKPGVLVLDVRTPDEFADGHIAGAKNLDFLGDDFEKGLAALPTDRPVIVHCAAGNRSSKVVAKIEALKLPVQILHMKAGFNGWKAAGKPVEMTAARK